MKNQFFETDLVKLSYYTFGNGPKTMLCFHGYGMHGRQFKSLENEFKDVYTFYGFDLFFHEQTQLQNNSLENIKNGIKKEELSAIFAAFCASKGIDSFSVLAYSMGSHYASTLVEIIPEKINEVIIAAPSCLNPGPVVNFFSRHKIGNKILEKLTLSENGMNKFLESLVKIKIIDKPTLEILLREVGTQQLRFNLYGCATYLRHLKLNQEKYIQNLNQHKIKSYYIFGERDKNYPPKIGKKYLLHVENAKQLIVPENHDMINANFSQNLLNLLHDN